MASEAPPFWWEKPDWRAALLWPVSWVYGKIALARMDGATPKSVDAPVLCVGNLTVGGGGKTPTSVAIAAAARKMKLNPGVVSRGYGGMTTGVHIVDKDHDRAKMVGDEPLLIAQHVPIAVSANRHAAAQMLIEKGCNFIIMDDGFQSMRLKTDYNLVVVDSRRGIGNGHVIPGGPLRAPIVQQLRHGDAVLKTGNGDAADGVIRLAARAGKQVLEAKAVPVNAGSLKKRRVLAFAGIADPDKFFDTLTQVGAFISLARTWPDHHYFEDDELAELAQTADAGDLMLVTTEKDAMRMAGGSATAKAVLEKTFVFRIEMKFDQPDAPQRMIQTAVERHKARRLGLR